MPVKAISNFFPTEDEKAVTIVFITMLITQKPVPVTNRSGFLAYFCLTIFMRQLLQLMGHFFPDRSFFGSHGIHVIAKALPIHTSAVSMTVDTL